MTLRRLTLAAAAFGALSAAACATLQVNSFVERDADISRYRSYNWARTGAQSTGDPRLDNNEFFRNRIRAQVERHLGERGFENAIEVGPDLLVQYHASVSQEFNANGTDTPYAACDSCTPYVFDAGTIVIDLVDARTERLVWRGWAEGSLDGAIDDQTFMERRIDEAVARIMERLPRGL